ncbi:MAG: SPFH domain-containing protein, partial [Elusimicrobiota bacterium]
MKPEIPLARIAGGILALILLNASVYTLPEWQQAVLTQFGRPVGSAVTQAGLHFKLPLIQKVHRL